MVVANGRSLSREVFVRFTRTDALRDALFSAQAEATLDDDERAVLKRLHSGAARRDYIAAHALSRKTIAELAHLSPAELRVRNEVGKRPQFVLPPNTKDLTYSISHAGGIALCAVAEARPVGVDVECLANVGDEPLNVARIICSAREMKILCSMPPAERAAHLLAIWTLKGAVAKATGLGFTTEMDRITIVLRDAGAPTVRFEAGTPMAAKDWRLTSWRLPPDLVVAAAVAAAPGEDISFKFDEERDLLPARRREMPHVDTRRLFGRQRRYPGMPRPVPWWNTWNRDRLT